MATTVAVVNESHTDDNNYLRDDYPICVARFLGSSEFADSILFTLLLALRAKQRSKCEIEDKVAVAGSPDHRGGVVGEALRTYEQRLRKATLSRLTIPLPVPTACPRSG